MPLHRTRLQAEPSVRPLTENRISRRGTLLGAAAVGGALAGLATRAGAGEAASGDALLTAPAVFDSPMRLLGPVFARAEGVVRVPRGARQQDVNLTPGIRIGAGASILLTPQDDPGDNGFFVRRISPTSFRIAFREATGAAVRLSYAVFN